MKTLETKQEIAIAINMHEMPVVRIDLADADEYGIKSQKVLIDNGKFRRLNPTDPDMPYLVRAEIRAFIDEKKFTFASHAWQSAFCVKATQTRSANRWAVCWSTSPTRSNTPKNREVSKA